MKFNKDTKIGELLEIAPEKAEILMEAGMFNKCKIIIKSFFVLFFTN